MSTTTKSIVDIIKGMQPAGQVPADKRKTTKDMNAATGKLHTSKDKEVLGIGEGRVITWSHVNFTDTDSERFARIAKSSGVKTSELGAMIVMDWFEQNRPEIETIAGEVLANEQSAEDIDKKMQALTRQLAKLREMSEAKSKSTTEK